GRVGRRNDLNLLQNVPYRRAVADNLLEAVLRGDFVLQVELFLSQPVLQVRDFPKGDRVLDGDGDLSGDVAQQIDLGLRERLCAAARDIERAEHATPG